MFDTHSGATQVLPDVVPWDYPVPPILYKYLPPRRLAVLRNCSVVFSHRSAFDDDHELSPDYARFGTEQQIWELVILHEINLADVVRPARPALSVDRLVKLIANHPGLQKRAIDSAKRSMKSPDLFGVFCLTEAADCERMWNEYADDCRGFAVGFDTTCAAFKKLKVPGRFGRVTSSDEPVGTFLSLATEDIGAAAVFFRKRMPYSFEREWRSVRAFSRLTRGPDDRYFADLDPECVREILIRPTCAVQQELRELLQTDRFRHVRLINVP
jgi:hypothetical protein